MAVYDYQIIANFLAGRGLAKQKLEKIKFFLESNNKTYRVLKIIKPTPISLIPSDGKTQITKGVICIGGDGTISETMGYLAKRKIDLPIFLIPTGTANFIAENIGVKINVSNNVLLKGVIRKYDLGVYEDAERKDFFLIGIGFGFEQRFLEMAKQYQKKFLGKLTYYLFATVELFRLNPSQYQVVLDKKNFDFKSTMITVLNLKPKISAFFPLFPEKDIKQDDGRLDFIYVEHKNFLFSFLGIFFFHFLGRIDLGLVKRFKAKEVEIKASEEIKSQIDGEIKGKLPFKISVIPGGVSFLV